MSISLAFIGSHSTGKTTLIEMVSANFAGSRVTVIKNVARGVIARGFPLAQGSTTNSFVNYVRDQLREERKALEQGYDILLSDRTILDAISYATTNKALLGSDIPDYFIEMLYEVWHLEAKLYNYYVFCPVEFPMVMDGVRIPGEEYRTSVGNKMAELLVQLNVPYLVASGTPDNRLLQVIQLVSRLNGDRRQSNE